MNIHENGYWLTTPEDKDKHVFDENLCGGIVRLISPMIKNYDLCYDLGCGPGDYILRLNAIGLRVIGFEGDPAMMREDLPIIQQDLTKQFNMPRADLVLCLEVGEHIPKHLENQFISNLINSCANGGTLILSWAIPGQEGDGHWNCQSNEYIIERLKDDFLYQHLATSYLKAFASNSWFQQSLMVFQKI